MKPPARLPRSAFGLLLSALLLPSASRAGHYTNFEVTVYTVVGTVRQLARNPESLSNSWQRITDQLKVDKVYIEAQRNRTLATDAELETVKGFFLDHGVKVAGGTTMSDGDYPGGGQFKSFCYTDANDREFIRRAIELAARHFDEIIQDDFFFVTTKYDSDIAAKGNRSWTQFRLDLMDEAAESLLIKPAKAVNPRVKMVIKFPNWYEHFAGSGFDLDKEPRLFDGIYTGTETRDPEATDQNLQPYESYLIYRYFENIAPGRNGGGWVDTGSLRYSDRYAEQLVDTVFAKAPEMMLFEWGGVTRPANAGARAKWQAQRTSFDFDRLAQSAGSAAGGNAAPTWGRVAGDALAKADAFLGKLGKPIGIASYRPPHAWAEDFLHNYFGMIGIPIELYPTFPTNANLVLLTEAAALDPEIVAKVKGQLAAGKSVVITSGLLRALQGKGIEDIVELQYTDRKILAHEYQSGFGAGNASSLANEQAGDVLFPDIRFLTNDAWQLVRALANGRGYPLLLMDRYSKGVLYVWTLPENFNDLYRLPPSVTTAIKNYVMAGFPVRLDGPSHVALFAYDNNTFIAQNYQDTEVDVRLGVAGDLDRLRNLVTDEVIARRSPPESGQGPRGGGRGLGEQRASFDVHLLPHSYAVFAAEKSAAAAKAANEGPRAPAILPGKGAAQHPFLYAGEWDTRKPQEQSIFIVRDGKIVWQYSMPIKTPTGGNQEFDDATLLSNGNVVFSRMSGAGMVSPDKKLLWDYPAPRGTEIHSCQSIGKDRVLIMRNGNPAEAMIINTATGAVEKEIPIPTPVTGTHGQFRHIRMTKAGTLLVPHLGEGKVVEYDLDGKGSLVGSGQIALASGPAQERQHLDRGRLEPLRARG